MKFFPMVILVVMVLMVILVVMVLMVSIVVMRMLRLLYEQPTGFVSIKGNKVHMANRATTGLVIGLVPLATHGTEIFHGNSVIHDAVEFLVILSGV
jgi:hypothetical protein